MCAMKISIVPAGTIIYEIDAEFALTNVVAPLSIPPGSYVPLVGVGLAGDTVSIPTVAPSNTSLPVATGAAQVGQVVTTTDGVWGGHPGTPSYQWLRGTTAISGANSASYTPVTGDIGSTLACRVTMTNAGGAVSATSLSTPVVIAAAGGAPVNTVLPVITGVLQPGQTASMSNGTWTNSPSGYVKHWTLDGVDAATGNTYLQLDADAGKILGGRVVASNGSGSATATAPAAGRVTIDAVTVGFFGQSNVQFTLGSVSPWDNLVTGRPVVNTPNITWVGTKQGRGAGAENEIESFPVTTANIASRNVSAAIGSLAAVLTYAMPGVKFVLFDAAVSGTGRRELSYDGPILKEDGSNGRGRTWADFKAMLDFVELRWGSIKKILEFWYANDQSKLQTFLASFAPFYFGQEANGDAATIGVDELDHMLWDITAAANAKGRGVFARDVTKYIPSLPRPDYSDEKRLGPLEFFADSRVQTFLDHVSPAPLIGAWNGGHPLDDDPDGGIYTMHSWAVPILKSAGMALYYPECVGIETGPGGAYADLLFTLPNGGNLSTTRVIEGRAAPVSPVDDYQAIMGIEVTRIGDTDTSRFAIVDPSKTSYATKYRGTVTLHSAGTGTGSDRRARVRVTPVVPFVSGDKLHFLRDYARNPGSDDIRQAVDKIWLNYPIETVSALRDTSAMYPFPGIAVQPTFTSFTADVSTAPATPIGTPTILANTAFATTTANHESASFTPSGTGAVYVIVAPASGVGTGVSEVVASATIGTPGRSSGGTALVEVSNKKKSRTGLVIYRVAAPVASAQTIQINYTANNPLAMRILVVQIPNAKSAAPVLVDDNYQNSLGVNTVTMAPNVTSAYNGVLYALARVNSDDALPLASTDMPVLFEGTNGPVSGSGINGAGRLIVGFEVPGGAGVQSTTISWATATANFRGAAVQVEPV